MNLHVAAVTWIASTLSSSCSANKQIHRHGEEELHRRELMQRWLNGTEDFIDAAAEEADISDWSGTFPPTITPSRVQGPLSSSVFCIEPWLTA